MIFTANIIPVIAASWIQSCFLREFFFILIPPALNYGFGHEKKCGDEAEEIYKVAGIKYSAADRYIMRINT